MKSEKYAQHYSTWSINAVNVGGPNGLVLKNYQSKQTKQQQNKIQALSKKIKNFPLFPIFFPELSVICNQLQTENVKWKFSEVICKFCILVIVLIVNYLQFRN